MPIIYSIPNGMDHISGLMLLLVMAVTELLELKDLIVLDGLIVLVVLHGIMYRVGRGQCHNSLMTVVL